MIGFAIASEEGRKRSQGSNPPSPRHLAPPRGTRSPPVSGRDRRCNSRARDCTRGRGSRAPCRWRGNDRRRAAGRIAGRSRRPRPGGPARPDNPARTARSAGRAPCRDCRHRVGVGAAARCLAACGRRGSCAHASRPSIDRTDLFHIGLCPTARASSRTGCPQILAGQSHLAPNGHAAARRARRATSAAMVWSKRAHGTRVERRTARRGGVTAGIHANF
jgi:hypothetical protein